MEEKEGLREVQEESSGGFQKRVSFRITREEMRFERDTTGRSDGFLQRVRVFGGGIQGLKRPP